MRWTQRCFSASSKKWLCFEDTKTKKVSIWKSIAKEMVENHGIIVTKEQCSGRCKTLKTAYKGVKDHKKKCGTVN